MECMFGKYGRYNDVPEPPGWIREDVMPAIAKGEKALLFGDFSYYWIADRQNRTFKRLNELYARTDQVGLRVDGKLILPEAIQALKMKGTKATGTSTGTGA